MTENIVWEAEQFYRFRMKIRKEKSEFFEKKILDFFKKAGREHLPWRKKRVTAYEVWVSEVMLQQTQVSRVIGYYERFLKRFPTVETLSRVSWEEFLPYYQGLGYYARGRNMLKTAKVVTARYQGTFPRDVKDLRALPGIGPYTAAAILSFAYGDEHLAWDTNVRRVIGRFFYGGKQLVADECEWETILKTKRKVLNAALMDFGSVSCVARPKCKACSLQTRCTYVKTQGKKERQTTKKSLGIKTDWSTARAMVFLHENHVRYFSSKKHQYAPFLLPRGFYTRAGIKDYFTRRYGVTVAVRPSHKKISFGGTVTLWVNAQILLGRPGFAVFPKSAAKEYTKSILKGNSRKPLH